MTQCGPPGTSSLCFPPPPPQGLFSPKLTEKSSFDISALCWKCLKPAQRPKEARNQQASQSVKPQVHRALDKALTFRHISCLSLSGFVAPFCSFWDDSGPTNHPVPKFPVTIIDFHSPRKRQFSLLPLEPSYHFTHNPSSLKPNTTEEATF